MNKQTILLNHIHQCGLTLREDPSAIQWVMELKNTIVLYLREEKGDKRNIQSEINQLNDLGFPIFINGKQLESSPDDIKKIPPPSYRGEDLTFKEWCFQVEIMQEDHRDLIRTQEDALNRSM